VPLLLQAITTPPDTAAAAGDLVHALCGGRVLQVETDGLIGWATDVDDADTTSTLAGLYEHHRLITEIDVRVAACLPARFPTWAADVDALRGRLRTHKDELLAQLEAVRGCCELAVTALWTVADEAVEAAPTPGTPGRRYLMERRVAIAGSDSRRARAMRLADELEQTIGAELVRAQRQVCPSATVALSSALLVRRSDAQQLLSRLQRTDQDVRILVNGPWPPYTFADVRSD